MKKSKKKNSRRRRKKEVIRRGNKTDKPRPKLCQLDKKKKKKT